MKSHSPPSRRFPHVAIVWLLLSSVVSAVEPTTLVQNFCVDCHGTDTQEAELDLFTLARSPAALRQDFPRLNRIVRAIESGEMPPDGADPQPTAAQRRQLVDWLKSEIMAIAAAERDDPGVVVMPRLSRHEYHHVIRDLTSGVVTDAGRLLPNEGGAGEGFANVGEAQGMSAAQYEKYLEAAKDVLRHLRVYPIARGESSPLSRSGDDTKETGRDLPRSVRGESTSVEIQSGDKSAHAIAVWHALPREPVDDPRHAIKEATDDIIAWYVAQQQKWGEQHRDALVQKFGAAHAVYLEAAWRARHGKSPLDEPLAPVALEKWEAILTDAGPQSPFVDWAKAWRALPADLTDEQIRTECLAIATGKRGGATEVDNEDYAPPYEISFHEAKEEVLEAATKDGHWPFRIEIGDAKELFLVVTDAGDGGRGEYAVWQKGRIVFQDGTAKPWQEVVTVVGANSGRTFAWGADGEGAQVLAPDAIGVRPPGALQFAVPRDAVVFEVDLTLDHNRTQLASIQSLVLKEKPKSQSYVPGRFVFGGRKRQADASQEENKQRDRLLRLRNVAEANKTKIGLNAERNVFADWTLTDVTAIGGPWDDQEPDRAVADAPYHYTVAEVRRNATADDMATLRELEERLVSIASPPPVDKRDSLATGWLENFARRAWRRPLIDDDRELLSRLYHEAAAEGLSYDSAVKVPLLAILVSPKFLYRSWEYDSASLGGAEVGGRRRTTTDEIQSGDGATHSKMVPLSSYSLASRLSFFLWASIPDDELLRLAAVDKLRDPEVLRAQARRMLRDARARSLATDFAGQLWSFSDFEHFTGPDPERFPEFTPELRRAMVDEVVLFLDDLFRNDRPLTLLIDADYTFANDLLATHCGLQRSSTDVLSLPPERRGLPGMALFLTKTSLPLRTSAVQRGVWISEQFLGREIPSPPANVAPISADETDAAGLTTREQLALHRANKTCAACHAKFDPFGVALENYDPLGRWRTTLREGGRLSSTDQLPDGREIAGSVGLRDYLLDHRDEVLTHFNRKLLGYALGRGVLPGDTALLERLSDHLPEHEYRLSFLVETIVTSPQFTNRRLGVQ